MPLPAWHEEPIAKAHPRDGFDCGESSLNGYLRRFARQNHESGGAKTFVAVADDSGRLLGFYSLAPATARYDEAPERIRKGLPRHDVPGYRLARLATDLSVQGCGLGGQLLLAAGRRCLRVAGEVGGVALFVDAKSERAAVWYESFGALRLEGHSDGSPRSHWCSRFRRSPSRSRPPASPSAGPRHPAANVPLLWSKSR